MSEEELINKMHSMFYKEINENDMRYTDVIYEQIEDLQQKVEQLENIRKEATDYCNTHYLKPNEPDLLNILNKGSE